MPIVQRVLRNWPLKLAALTLSLLVWVLVSAEETTSELVAVKLELEVPATLALASPLPEIRALVRAPGRELIKLYSHPLWIRAAVPAGAGTRWLLPIDPTDINVSSTAAISIEDVQPRELVIDVDRTMRRTIPVAVRGTLEARTGYRIDSLTTMPGTVTVSGARLRVAQLDSAPTEALDLRDLTAGFQRTVAIDTASYPLLRFAPQQVVIKGRARKR